MSVGASGRVGVESVRALGERVLNGLRYFESERVAGREVPDGLVVEWIRMLEGFGALVGRLPENEREEVRAWYVGAVKAMGGAL